MMDTQAIRETAKSLSAAAKDSNVEQAMTLLHRLERDVRPTPDLLKETNIGVLVGELRKDKDETLAKLATKIINGWKGEMKMGQTTTKSRSITPLPAKAVKGEHMLTPKSRSGKTDGVQFDVTGESIRNVCLERLYDALVCDAEEKSEVVMQLAREIEQQTFERDGNGASGNPYRDRMRSLFSNLKAVNNPGLRRAVLEKRLTVERLCAMDVQQMASAERQEADQQLREEFMKETEAPKPVLAETDAFTCARCKGKRTTYYQMQTRSADEPMTTFVTCLQCGHKWKFC